MAKTKNTASPGEGAKVEIQVRIDGQPVERTNVKVHSLIINRAVNRIPSAKLSILDGDVSGQNFSILNQDLFVPGKRIDLFAGYDAADTCLFKGIVTGFSAHIRRNGSPALQVECRHPVFRMTLNRRSRYFTGMRDDEIIEEVLKPYEAGVFTARVQSTAVKHPEMVQYDATDWDFLLMRAEANGRIVVVKDDEVIVKIPDTKGDPVFSFQYGNDSSLREFDAGIDARLQFATVQTTSWDAASQKVSQVESNDPGVTETGNLPAGDLAKTGKIDYFHLQHGGRLKDDELQAWADARFLRSRLAKVNGRVQAAGAAGVYPGDMIQLGGISERLNGKVMVSGLVHTIREGHWSTDLQFGLSPEPFSGRRSVEFPESAQLLPSIRGLQAAVVEQLEKDPEGEDRILVRLPMIDLRKDGIWARVASLDAGQDRGFFFRPEIGDEVILGFINDDPRDAVVLGMLHSSAKPAPFTAKDENHEKGFVSRSKIRLTFNDDKKSVTLETPGGRQFILDDDQGVATMKDANGNKLIMNAGGITIESGGDITIKASGDLKAEAGKNMESKAGAQYKAEGTAGAEVSTGAVAVLKGSLVQIN